MVLIAVKTKGFFFCCTFFTSILNNDVCGFFFFFFLLIPVMHLSLWFLEAGFVGVKPSGNEDDHFDRLSQVREAIRQKRCEERGQTYIPPNEVSGTQEYVIQVSAKSANQNLVFPKIGSSWQLKNKCNG